MDQRDPYDELKNYAQNSENYKGWRREHTKIFGDLFKNAFRRNEEAQICFTAALTDISQRNFALAMPKLDLLESICESGPDETAVLYFKGLNYEMLGEEAKMTECYERLGSTSPTPKFPFAFHPYYRTAKFAQRDSECSKAVYYYRKALEFYDGTVPSPHEASVASRIIYDIATLYLYMHEYGACERFLEASYRYDPAQNQQRDYVRCILLAAQGKRDECTALLKTLSPFLRENCQPMTEAIFRGTDPHYCTVPQDRSLYGAFWSSFSKDEASIRALLADGKTEEAEAAVSGKLTEALGFMKRPLNCRIERAENGEGATVILCKNYRVKSLIAEHAALFALKPPHLHGWEFESVSEFEPF